MRGQKWKSNHEGVSVDHEGSVRALMATFGAPKDIAMSLKDTLMGDAPQHHEGF